VDLTGKRGRRGKRPEGNLKETRRYWTLKEETLDRTLWRSRTGRDYIPLIRQTIFDDTILGLKGIVRGVVQINVWR